MDEARFEALARDLARPEAWGAAGPVEVRRTHISVVFLVGDRAYKIKRPVRLDFLDFSTLERRRRMCEAEVQLNRRLAPGVYLGVVELAGQPPRLRGDGEVVEVAVEMRRLSDDDSLAAHLQRGTADAPTVRRVAQRLADFHATAARSPAISTWATAAAVADNARENFDQTGAQIGVTVHPSVHARLATLTEEALQRLRPLLDRRAAAGVTCDTHGDLRVDHVYLLPDGPVAIDCIEFADRYRYADPVADVAFLAMDMGVRGHTALARELVEAWFAASGDADGRPLLDFYVAYRSLIRAKVAGLAAAVGDATAGPRARRHWLYALSILEAPARRPALIGVGGLPGTGKSTVAAGLGREAGFEVVRSDQVRRELLGPDTRSSFGRGAYTEESKDRIYTACLDRADAMLTEGRRVVIDASFWKERWRRALLDRAVALGVPGLLLTCETPHEVARQRLRQRTGDVSDADEAVHAAAVLEWEAPADETRPLVLTIDASGAPDQVLQRAIDALEASGVA